MKITLDEYKKQKNKITGQSHTMEKAIQLQKEVSPFWPCRVMIEVIIQDKKKYLEYAQVELIGEFPIIIQHDEYKKKYRLFFNPYIKGIGIEHNIGEAPNEIGKLTTKKIQQWVEYLIGNHKRKTLIAQENLAATERLLQRVRSFNGKVSDHRDKEGNGRIFLTKGGLEYQIRIINGYIDHEQILFSGITSSYDTFLLMADNQYRGKK